MDDYSVSSLNESKNEWCARLVNILTPCIIEGLKSILKEAIDLCIANNESDKYLMTFQSFLGRIPQWNKNIISDEKKRIEKTSNCGYLEELITCVHIIQLKALSCVRVGTKQKKIDIDIPSVDDFIHKVYIFTARKVYTNIYLFQKNISPLSIQKNNRELENIIKECILNTIRETIPVEMLLRAYMDETEEHSVEVKEEIINVNNKDIPSEKTEDLNENTYTKQLENDETREILNTVKNEELSPTTPSVVKTEEFTPTTPSVVKTEELSPTTPSVVKTEELSPTTQSVVKTEELSLTTPSVVKTEELSLTTPSVVKTEELSVTSPSEVKTEELQDTAIDETDNLNNNLTFSDLDKAVDVMGNEENLSAPKDIEHLENLAKEREREQEIEYEDEDEDEDDEKITIGKNINLDTMDIENLNNDDDNIKLNDLILNDVEVLV